MNPIITLHLPLDIAAKCESAFDELNNWIRAHIQDCPKADKNYWNARIAENERACTLIKAAYAAGTFDSDRTS